MLLSASLYMDYTEMLTTSPYADLGTLMAISKSRTPIFQRAYGVHDITALTPVEFLQFKLCQIEYDTLPCHLQQIVMATQLDPKFILSSLKEVRDSLSASPNIITCLPSLSEKLNTMINDCCKIMNNVYKLSRALKKKVQHYIAQREYSKLIQCFEDYINEYPESTTSC